MVSFLVNTENSRLAQFWVAFTIVGWLLSFEKINKFHVCVQGVPTSKPLQNYPKSRTESY